MMVVTVVRKIKKSGGKNEQLEMNSSSLLRNFSKKYFPIGSCCQHAWYEPISYWSHDMAACCYFGVDLRNQLDHNFPSRFTDGTPHSSSDLLSPSLLLLPFTKTNYSQPNSILFSSLGQIILSPNFPLCSSGTENSKSSFLQKYFQSDFLSDS